MRILSNRQRLAVFVVGFVLGCVVVSLLLRGRQRRETPVPPPPGTVRRAVPGLAAQWMHGRPVDAEFVVTQMTVPAATGAPALRRFVMPGLDEGTYVLIEHPIGVDGAPGPAADWRFMSADRVRVRLAPGADTKGLAETMAPQGWRFAARERDDWVVVALGAHRADTVPAALAQLRGWPEWVAAAEPEFLPPPKPPGAP